MHIYKCTNTVNNKVYIGQTIQDHPYKNRTWKLIDGTRVWIDKEAVA